MSTYLEFKLTAKEYSNNNVSVTKIIKNICKSLELDIPNVNLINTEFDNISLIRTQDFKIVVSNLDGILALDFLKQLYSELNELAVAFTLDITNFTMYN